jgi:hypothetical protein
MKEIRYRQYIKGTWHYWGFMPDGSFRGPASDTSVGGISESQQFTGLHDKNGKEIYEGDVIHCMASVHTPERSFSADEKKPVTFEDGAFRYDGITLGDMLNPGMRDYTFEVIGDIYQHPELLKP